MWRKWWKIWQARKWMKQNEAFLPTWHAYIGYTFHLFSAFQHATPLQEVARIHRLSEEMLRAWIDVGVAVGHLERDAEGRVKATPYVVTYFTKESEQCIGELLREMMEMHIPALLSYKQLLKGEAKPNFYGDVYGQTVASTSALIERLALRSVRKAITPVRPKRLLDVGCGEAGYIMALANEVPQCQFIGIDINGDVVNSARERIQQLSLTNVEVLHGNFNDYTDGTFDAAMVNNILHYYSPQDRQQLFAKLQQSLNEAGVLVVITPLNDALHGQRFAAAFNSFMIAHDNLYHLPTEEELMVVAERSGLTYRGKRVIIREGSWYMLQFEK